MIIDRLIRLLTRRVYRKGHIHGTDGSLYMGRWELFETRWIEARVHHITRPDLDREMHDHPAGFLSLVLKGWYDEALPSTIDPCWDWRHGNEFFTETRRRTWSIAYRPATARHRITRVSEGGVWTLFILVGGRKQWWGFYTPAGKVHWKDYLAVREGDQVGRVKS